MPEKEVKQKAVTPKKPKAKERVVAEQLKLEEPSAVSAQPIAAGLIERLQALKKQKEDTQFGGLNHA